MKRHPFDSAPFPPDTFTIPAEDRARLRRALEGHFAGLRRMAGKAKWFKDGGKARADYQREAREVGRLLDVLDEER